MNYGLSVLPGMRSLVFSKLWHCVKNPYVVVRVSAKLFEKKKKKKKFAKNFLGFFELIKRFGHYFLLNLVWKVYYLLYSRINPTLEKKLVQDFEIKNGLIFCILVQLNGN